MAHKLLELQLISFLILVFLLAPLQLSAVDQDAAKDEDTRAMVERSKATRAKIEASLPAREIASIEANQVAMAKEFEELMENNQDKEWWSEVDKVIADTE